LHCVPPFDLNITVKTNRPTASRILTRY